jgi:hypothetical protein
MLIDYMAEERRRVQTAVGLCGFKMDARKMMVSSMKHHETKLRRYVDACKIVKGLDPKFGNFITKAAEVPVAEKPEVIEEAQAKPDKAKKDSQRTVFAQENANLLHAYTYTCIAHTKIDTYNISLYPRYA